MPKIIPNKSDFKFSDFVKDKQDFFSSLNHRDSQEFLNTAKTRAKDKKHGYGFVAKGQHLQLIEAELEQLSPLLPQLIPQDNDWLKHYWMKQYALYDYYHALLEEFQKDYNQKKEAALSAKKQAAVEKLFKDLNKKLSSMKTWDNDSFWTWLAKQIYEDFLLIPFHTSKIKKQGCFINLRRVHWYFCRTSMEQIFFLALSYNWLTQLQVTDVINLIGMPTKVLRVFGVAFFVVRFLINLLLMIMHLIGVSKNEKNTSLWQRFKNELYKRHYHFLNDLVWAIINFVTGFKNLSLPLAGALMIGFLIFDTCMLVWMKYLAEEEYLTKRAQYKHELNKLNTLNRPLTPEEREQVTLLKQQLEQLEVGWVVKNSTFWFNITAAALLVVGFAASVIFTVPAVVISCNILCAVAASMYFSNAAYSQYKEKSCVVAKNKNALTKRECKAAFNNCVSTLVKNTLMPMFAVAVLAVCWQAALLLTVAYMAYGVKNAYDQRNNGAEKETPLKIRQKYMADDRAESSSLAFASP